MAAALQKFTSSATPNRSHRPVIRKADGFLLPTSYMSRFQTRPVLSSDAVPALLPSISNVVHGRRIEVRQRLPVRWFRTHVVFAAPQEDSVSADSLVHNGEDSGKEEIETKINESLIAWKQMLELVKEEAVKMRHISWEAYDAYSKKAIKILKESSENVKVQADQARHELNKVAEVISEEGKGYLSTVADNSPETMRDIVETFASSPDEVKHVSEVREFYFGIPYGCLLVVAGFLHFMLFGSLSGIRFGVILGGILLFFSVSSMRAWKSGKSSTTFLKGQAAITTIIFFRELNLLSQRVTCLSVLTTLLSGAMLAFYIYRIAMNGQDRGPSLEQTSKN